MFVLFRPLIASLFILSLIGLVQCRITPTQKQGMQQIAPDFSLPSLDGGRYSLQSAADKTVLLHFWATWCVQCIHELESLHNLYRTLDHEKFEIITIAIDDRWEEVNKVRIRGKYLFPMLIDVENMSKGQYGISGIPQTLLINPQREIIALREPETGKPMQRTYAPQRWDDEETIAYFRKLLEQQ